MKWNRWVVISVLAVGVCLIGWVAGARASASLTGQPTAVAVVDIMAVFESLKEKVQVEADLKTRLERINEDEQNRKKDLQALQGDLEILAPGTPAFQEKQDELERGVIELQAWKGFQQKKLHRENAVHIENLYRKTIDSIGAVSRDNGYDIVMFKEKPVNFSSAKPEALPTLIQVRKVLWSSDELDLTEQVIQRMNNEFTNLQQ